jgi:predicted thioredoxin/glutaredoxin
VSQPTIRVYSRPGCHLCEQLIEALLPRARGRAEVDVVDIDSRPDWQADFGTRIPVVEIDGQFVCQYALDADALERALAGNPPTPV